MTSNDKPAEFKSFLRTVGANEGAKCHYPTRLDSYGCGCGHNCVYCYAKSQLVRRKKWNPTSPAVADVDKVALEISKIPEGSVIRLGGLTDCFQPCEESQRVTLRIIELLNKRNIHYLIVTKSALVADDIYISAMRRELAHIQVSVTFTDPDVCAHYENASAPKERIAAIEKLQKLGFDVAVRLSPLIPGMYDPEIINGIKCDKLLVEFLRSDPFIEKWFPIDWLLWSVRESGYKHMSLDVKLSLLAPFTSFKQISVCDDCTEHYNYWKDHFNPNPSDCCNLSLDAQCHEMNEARRLQVIGARNADKRTHINKARNVRVTFPDGRLIFNKSVKQTYFDTIATIGADRVQPLGIMRAGSNIIVDDVKSLKELYRAEILANDLGNGQYLFAHMSTEAKINILVDINRMLNLGLIIEYV